MNQKTKQVFGVTLLFFSTFVCTNAQTTNATITISNKSFPDASSGGSYNGSNLKIQGLYVYVNEQFVGSLTGEEINSANNCVISNLISLSDNKTILKFLVYYRYYNWPGHSPVFEYKMFETSRSKDIQDLSSAGTLIKQTFNSFSGMELGVDWSFDYEFEISAFRPVLKPIPGLKCYNASFSLTLDPLKPLFYDDASISYSWEYGEVSNELLENSDFFNVFLDRIASNIEYWYSANPNICEAIRFADYSSMKEYMFMYTDLIYYKNNLINELMECVLQYNPEFTEAERSLIYNFFPASVNNQDSFPQPYLLTTLVKNWIPLGNSIDIISGLLEFTPASYLPTLNDKLRAGFRARAFNGTTGSFSPWSENLVIADILPFPPRPGSISLFKSCANSATGRIEISGITSDVPTERSAYNYWLTDINLPHNVTPEDTLNWPSLPTPFTESDVVISGVAAGKYKLFLNYENPGIRNCLIPDTIEIPAFPLLHSVITNSDVNCPGGSDGSIGVIITEGAGEYRISLNDAPFNTGAKTFFSLLKGNYKVTTADKCLSTDKYINVTEPDKVIISQVYMRNPTCSFPPNGGFEISVSGGTCGLYDFNIYSSSGELTAEKTNQPSPWSYYSLRGGTYIIKVYDHNKSNCEAVLTSVTLNPVIPLNLTLISKTNVVCFGDNTGEMQVIGSGGTGVYEIKLGSKSITSNPAVFGSLSKGIFNFEIMNADQTCFDIKPLTEEILENNKIKIDLTPQDVKCFGNKDGQINTVVEEGTHIYRSYSWEIFENGNWDYYPSANQSPANLDVGDYRLTVEDSGGCRASERTSVSQPPPLSVTSVTSFDNICYGEKGRINISASGGKGFLDYYYSLNGSGEMGYVSGSPLPTGSYILKVKDENGCESGWKEFGEDKEVIISGPTAPLDFTTSLSNFSGFNVSCYGFSDGTLTVYATGGNGYTGNGGLYSGYIYSLSGRSDQTNGYFRNLGAGTYDIKVTDGRGCTVTKQVIITQPEVLNLPIPSVEDVSCFGSASGKIFVAESGGGGVQPYSYQLNNMGYVYSGVFTGLIPGTYQIYIRDKNSCLQNLSATVTNKNQKLEATLIPYDVRCFGENNGQISASVKGGAGGFEYVWEKRVAGTWLYSGSSQSDARNLGPGNYRLIVTDSDNCSDSVITTIMEPPVLSVSGIVPHDIICFGGSGSIDISATGGNGGYIFAKSVNNDNTYSGFTSGEPLQAAIYKLKVTDIKGCDAKWNSDVVITAPVNPLSYTASLSDYNGFNISCYGKADGSILLTPAGGNDSGYTGYTYSFSGVDSNTKNIYTNLISGVYNISVRDGRGCITSGSITLSQPAQISFSVSKLVNTKCFNDSSGVITLDASGGAQPYEYMIAQKSFVKSNEFSGLATGNYFFTVKDKNGCTSEVSSRIINIFPRLSLSIIPQDIKCYGRSDGVIESSLTGGSGTFDLKWFIKSGNLWEYLKSDSSRISNLTPGDYRIQVTDLAGCPAIFDSTSIYRKVTPLVIDHVLMNDIVCFGEKGSITIQASGSNGGYIYQYSKDNQPFINFLPGSPVFAAAYKLKVTDAKGCEALWPESLIITNPSEPLSISWTVKDYSGHSVSCFGNSDGLLSVQASGGNGAVYKGYSYNLSGRSVQTDSLFKNLKAGIYSLNITDARGCSLSKQVTLTQAKSELGLWTTGIKEAACVDGNDGMVALAASGGSLPYSYSIGDNGFVPENEFKGLGVNKYRFTVKDANGCTQILDTAIFNIVPKMQISGVQYDIGCVGQNNGSISANIMGGVKPFIYKWNEITSTNPYVNFLAKGKYTLSVTDSAGCKTTKIFEIKEPSEPLVIDKVKLNDIVCYGNSGSVNIQARGSNGNYVYQYSKDNQSFVNYSPGAPLLSGEYKFRVTDAKGCEKVWDEKVFVTEPKEALGFNWIAKDYNGSNVSCYGYSDGVITLKGFGGNDAGYQGYYFRLPGRPVNTDTVLTNLSADTYSISIIDARGCEVTKNISLKPPSDRIEVVASVQKDVKCFNDSSGVIILSAAGGVEPYEFRSGQNSFNPSNEFIRLPAGDWSFMVRDKNGCTASVTSSIRNLYPKPSVELIPSDIKCYQKNDGSISANFSGGSGSFSFNWFRRIDSSWQYFESDKSIITGLAPGDYLIQVTDKIQCPSFYDSTTVFQKVTPLSITAISEPACTSLKNGKIFSSASGGIPPYKFSIDQSQFQKTSTFQVFGGLHKVYVADSNSCVNETGITVSLRNALPLLNFVVATSRYELDTLVIKDVSLPRPDRVMWEFTPEASLIASNQYEAKVMYPVSGVFPVRMTGYFGTCDYTLEKLINVAPYDPLVVPKDKSLHGIESTIISPNPNDGIFKIKVRLYNKQQVQLKILDYYSKLWHYSRYPAALEFEQEISMPGALPGTYILWVISENDSRTLLFIISK